MKRRLVSIALIALAIALAGARIAIRARPAFAAGTTLRLVITESPKSLDPLLASTVDEQTVESFIFDSLLVATPSFSFAPRLATQVPTLADGGISRDGKTVVFHLRHGVKWSDGVPLTSADVAFTIRAILDPKLPIPTRDGYDRIVRVETPDAWTVVFHLRVPYAPFVATIGTQYPVLPAHLLAKSTDPTRDPFGNHPIGTGPYRLERVERFDRIELAANPAYWGGAPKIARVTFFEIPNTATQAIQLRDGQIDYAAVESSTFGQLRSLSTLRTFTSPLNDFVAFAFNVKRPILRDVRVRRAVVAAIDRARIVKTVTFGTGTVAYADLPTFLWTDRAPPDPNAYDPKRAAALLDAAGWKLGPSGIRMKDAAPLVLSFIEISGSTSGQLIDTQIQQMLRAVGVDAKFKYYSASLYYAAAGDGGPVNLGRFDAAFYGFDGGAYPQNEAVYGCAQRSPAGFNAARYCDPEMEGLQRAANAEPDDSKRRALLAKIEQLAARDVPYLFLYHTPWRIVANPKLRGAKTSLSDYIYGIEGWSFAD